MKFRGFVYNKVIQDANLISTIASQMGLSDLLEKGKYLKNNEILVEYEHKELIGIKDSIARIWSSLELNNVEGHLDHVFENKEDEKIKKG